MRRTLLAAAAAAALAGPAGAQLPADGAAAPQAFVETRGDVRLAGPGRNVGPGGYLRAALMAQDGTSRQVEIVGLADGSERRDYRVNGVPRPYAEGGDSLLAQVLRSWQGRHVAGDTALLRLREAQGLSAVLAEVEKDTDGMSRGSSLLRLLADPSLTPAEVAQVLASLHTPRAPERRSVLLSTLLRAAGLPTASQAVLVADIVALPAADTFTWKLLQEVPHRVTLDDPAVANAFYAAPRDTLTATPRRVLNFLVAEDPSLPPTYLAGAIDRAADLPEGARVRLLLAVPTVCLRSATLRAAYVRAAGQVAYEMDRVRLLDRLRLAAAAGGWGTPPPCGR